MTPRKSEAEWEARPTRDTDTVRVLLTPVDQPARAINTFVQRVGSCY